MLAGLSFLFVFRPLTTDETNIFNDENCSGSQNHCLNENHQEYKIDENKLKEKPVPLPRPGTKMPKVKPTPKPRSFSVSQAEPRGNLNFSAKQDAGLEKIEVVMKLQDIKRSINSLERQNNLNKNRSVLAGKEKPALKEKPKLAKPKLPAKPKISVKPKVPDKSTDLSHKRTKTRSLNNETKPAVEIKNRSQSKNTYNSNHNNNVNENLPLLSECTHEEDIKEQESNNNEKIKNPIDVCVNRSDVECHDKGKPSRTEQLNEPTALSPVICDKSSDKNYHKEQIIETNTVFQDTGAKSEKVKNNRSNAEDAVVDSLNSDQDVIHENVIKNLDEVDHLTCKSEEQVVQTSSKNLSGVNEIKNMKEISDSNPINRNEIMTPPSNNLEKTNEIASDYEEMTGFSCENSVKIRNPKNIKEISKNSLKERGELHENKLRNAVETDKNTESEVDETSDDDDDDEDEEEEEDRSTFKKRALSSNDLIESLICPSHGRSTLNSRKFQPKTARSQSLVDLDDIANSNSNSSHELSKTFSLAPAKKYRNHNYVNTEIYVKKRNKEQTDYENVEINIETVEESRVNKERLDISEQSGFEYMTPMPPTHDTSRNKIIRFSGDIGLISHPRTNPKDKDPNQSGIETNKHFNVNTFMRDSDFKNNANNSNVHESHSSVLSSNEPCDSHLSNKIYADKTHLFFNQEPHNIYTNKCETEKDLIKTENIYSVNTSLETKVTEKVQDFGESIYDAPRSDVSKEQHTLTDLPYSAPSRNDLKEKQTHKNLSHSKTLPISISKNVFDVKEKGKYIVNLEEDNPLYNSSSSTGSENSYNEQRYSGNARKSSPIERRPEHGSVEKKRSLDSNVPHQQHFYEDVELPSNFQGIMN